MEMKENTERYVNGIKAACTSEEELGCLTQLIRHLEANGAGTAGIDGEKRDDDLEAKYLRAAASSNSSKQSIWAPCDSVFSVEEDLHDFVAYVFLRRYGWSETITDETVHRMKRAGRASSNESELKAPMNSVLDEFLSWMSTQKISLAMLHAYISALDRASSHHLVRKLLVTNTMTWLTRHFPEMDSSLFDKAKHLVMAGLGDCWSAVRSACAGKLGRLLDRFKLEQLESFFMSIVTVCRDPSTSWQAQEGAAMAAGVVIKRFHLTVGSTVCTPPSESSTVQADPAVQNGVHLLKFGKDQLLTHLPGFISANIFDVAYRLLRHEQLSIREFGIKALSSYLMCCDFEEAIRTLDDVVIQLRRGCGMTDKDREQMDEVPATAGPGIHSAGLGLYHSRNTTVWMDAYAAEGLLGVCVFLVKHIPSNLLLPCWQMYFSTFALLLMHPASTVRQAASTVFKFIVSRGASNPMVLWLVLHGLSSDELRVVVEDDEALAQQTGRHMAVSDGGDCSHLTTTATSSDDELNNNNASASVAAAAGDLAALKRQQQPKLAAWEFFEGRLLTYELVLRFLNKNHWLYVFDVDEARTASATMASALGLRSSVLMASASGAEIRGRQMMPHTREHINKVHTYAGATFKTSFDIVDARGDPTALPGRQLLRSLYGRRPSQSTSVGYLGGRHSKPEAPQDARALTVPAGAAVGVVAQPQLQLQSSSHRVGFPLAACSLLQAAKVLHHGSHSRGSDGCIGQNVTVQNATVGPTTSAVASSCSPPCARSIRKALAEPTYLQQQQQQHCREANNDGLAHADGEAMTMQCPFSSTFETMFVQTVDCIASDKWELQRIGGQVLPCLTETIGWYNVNLLKKLWDQHLTVPGVVNDRHGGGSSAGCAADSSALCYGACLSLLYMLRYAVKLRQLLDPDRVLGLQHDDRTRRDEVRSITDCVDDRLPRLLPHVAAIMNRPRVDRLSAVALQVVSLAVSSFDHLEIENTEQFLSDVARVIGDVAGIVHPDLSVTTTCAPVTSAVRRHWRSFPTDGYLSFCSHDTSKEDSSSRHVMECSERHLLSDAVPCLLALARKFYASTVASSLWNILPILAYHACATADDLLRKTLADSVNTLLSGMATSCQLSCSVQGQRLADDIRATCVAVLCRQVKAIHAEASGPHRIRAALDLMSSVCLSQDGSGYRCVDAVIRCLCDQWQSSIRVGSSALHSVPIGCLPLVQPGKPVGIAKDLEILSNDINGHDACSSASEPTDDEDSIDDDDENTETTSVKHDAIFSETEAAFSWCGTHGDTLTLSGAAGVTPIIVSQNSEDRLDGDAAASSQGDGRSSPHGSDGSGSAWDSWDDPDEEPDSGNLFSDCISKVVAGLVQLGRRAEVEQELARLPNRERSLVRAALLGGAQLPTTSAVLQF